jgi:hypothetical protein
LEPFAVAGDKVSDPILRRVFSGRYVRLFLAILRTRSRVVWVWGHDAAFVASIAAVVRPDIRLIWDISDVNRHLLDQGAKGATLRLVERILVRRANRLLLTSPGFYDRHYSRFVDRRKTRVVENRRSPRQRTEPVVAPRTGPLQIVFAGIFRSPKVLEAIGQVAARLTGQVEFHLHGYANRTLRDDLPARLAGEHANVHFHGPYDATDIGAVYRTAHLVWAFTDPAENHNERWLLSNRLYDAIVTRRPVITNDDTASGDYAVAHRLGLAVPMEADAIVRTLEPYLDPGAEAYHALVSAMPDPATGYMSGEYARVIEELIDE